MSEKLDEIVRNRIDSIAPEDGAGERMLENIKRKAANSQDSKKVIPWKKIIKFATPLAACIAIVIIIGINGNKDGGMLKQMVKEPVGNIANQSEACLSASPATISSAEEIKTSLGIEFTVPEDAYDVEYYITAENEASVRFLYNGHEYEIRTGENEASGDDNDAGDALFYEVTWTEGEVTYTLINGDGADRADFDEVYNETKSDEN